MCEEEEGGGAIIIVGSQEAKEQLIEALGDKAENYEIIVED